MKPRRYQYQALPKYGAIRLLRLIRGISNPVQGTLLTTSFDDAPRFHALSYTWGTTNKTATFLLDGTPFAVTPGLAAGLDKLASNEELHDQYGLVYIWIDQICINQDDTSERGFQVEQMNRIYSTSNRTIAWLGIDGGFAELAAALFHRIDRIHLDENALSNGERRMMLGLPKTAVDWKHHESLGLPATESKSWRAMAHYITLPWFRRAWVIQEVVLSPKDPILLCDDIICSWETVAWAADWLQKRAYRFEGHVSPAVQSIQRVLSIRLNLSTCSLGGVLLYGTTFQVTDPRDSIYALLGIIEKNSVLSGAPVPRIKADYTLSVTEALQRAVLQIIASTNSLAILNILTGRLAGSWDLICCYGTQSFWYNRPSWLPHLEENIRPVSLATMEMHYAVVPDQDPIDGPHAISRLKQFSASAGLPVLLERTFASTAILSLKGLAICKVKSFLSIGLRATLLKGDGMSLLSMLPRLISAPSNNHDERQRLGLLRLLAASMYEETLRWQHPLILQMWELALQERRHEDPLALAWDMLHATTMGMDPQFRPWTSPGLAHFCAFLADMNRRWPSTQPSARLKSANDVITEFSVQVPGDPQAFADSFGEWCRLRRFFVTEDGRFGLGPTSMRAGDMVCVLFGGKVPYMLRKTARRRWLFVGDCHVHGLLEGQAVEAWKRGELQEKTFHLH